MRIPKHLINPPSTPLGVLPAVTLALAAAGVLTSAHAQLQTAGALLVNVDATSLPAGPLSTIANSGTMGGVFEARGGADQTPTVAAVYGTGTKGILFDGNDFLQHSTAAGGALIPADAGITGVNPSSSVEVWVLNPSIPGEETLVSWGHRGGPDGSNMSFNYGSDARWGAVGHWGGPDIGWDSCCDGIGGAPPGVPSAAVWHHLVYTYDGTTQRIYSDGVLKNSENVNLNLYTAPAILIGAQYDDDVNVTGGLRASSTIARVRVHQDALTPAQVLNNYNFEKANFTGAASYVNTAPIHRYRFAEAAGGAPDESVVSDSIGTSHGRIQGVGATFTGSRVTLPGGNNSGEGSYVDLPARLLSVNSVDNGGSGQITFEGWTKLTGVRNWARILDVGTSGTPGTVPPEVPGPGGGGEGLDYIFYAASEGTTSTRHNVTIRNTSGATGPEEGVGFETPNQGRDFHWAVTWDELGGIFRVYENGNEVANRTVTAAQNRFSTVDDVNVWLGRSNWTGDGNMQGEFDEFRIYNKVLTAEEVARSAALGAAFLHVPGAAPAFEAQPKSLTVMDAFGGASASFSAELKGQAPISLQWYKNNSAVAGANGTSYSLSATTADNAAQIYLVANNGIGGSVTSSVAVLTVTADTAPPVILGTGGGPGWGLDETHFGLRFNEPVNKADAENLNNYTTTGGITLSSAVLQADNITVLFTSSSIKSFGTKELLVSNIRDRASAQNAIPANTRVGIVFAEGTIRYEQFNETGGGVNVSDLLNHPKFPNAPDVIQNLTQFENPAGGAGQGDNYGSRFQGFLTAPVSGAYTFYIAADDGAALWLSTDASPAHKVQIAREPIWSGFRTYTGAADGGGRVCPGPDCNISPAVTLQGGARYYVEMIYKEGIGGDFGSVAWQTPANGPAPGEPARGSAPIQRGYLSPFNVAPTINQDVADVTILDGRKATFVSDIFGTSPLTYQWYRNGQPIEGATGPTHTTDYQHLPGDNGATFYVVVQNTLGTIQSRTASLTVNADPTAPTIVAAVGSATFDTVTVQLSEPAEELSAEDPFDWTITSSAGPIDVNDVVLSADGMTLTLSTGLQTENTLYTVTCGGSLVDLAGNHMVAGSSVNFRSFVMGTGGVLFESFLGIGGNVVTDLTGHPNFPNSPNDRLLIGAFNSRLAYADDSHENYGARMRGIFIPPTSGNWIFYMAADDGSQLIFNPAGPSATGAQVLLTRNACCGDYASANSQSAPQALVGGRGYYLEMLYKEGGGGDWGQVAARLQGAGVPPTTEWIPGTQLGVPAAPPGVAGEITITQQPASIAIDQNTTFSFSVVASNPNGLPMSFQWSKNGTAITGANAATYSRVGTLDESGSVFTVEIGMIGNRVTSAPATLTVRPDTTAPTLVSGKAGDFLDRVTIKFSELMGESASDAFAYTLTPNAGVADAVLQADGMTVLITLVPGTTLQENTQYTVNVGSGVADRAGNSVAAGASIGFRTPGFTAGFINFKAYHGTATPVNIGQIAGNLVSDLVAHPSFPDKPTETFVIPGFNSRFAYPNDAHETYGATMTGLFVPPASGNYVFYMAADDGSQLKFNPTGSTPSGAQVLLTRDACCGDYTSANSQSLPQALVAGQRYYIEMLYKEGGGGDWGQVAARLEGQAIPPIGEIIASENIGSYQNLTGSGINITQQPADALKAIDPNNPGANPDRTFSVAATSGTQPVYYRWQRNNGTGYFDVSFSTNPSYTLTPALADNGAKFRVIISAPGAQVTSSEATLTVVQLNTAPQFTLQATTAATEDSGAQTVAGFATGILPHSIARTPITLNYDFSSVPSGVTQENRQNDAPSALPLIRDGILKITDAVNGSLGGFATPAATGLRIESFTLDFNLRVGGGTCCGGAIPEGTSRMADGLSISFGNNTGVSSGEEGSGTGLIVSFDLWDNGGGDDAATAPNVDVKWANAVVPGGYQAFAGEREGGRAPSGPLINDPATGQPMTMLTGAGFAPVRIHMDSDGTVDVDFKGVRLLNNVATPYEAILGPRIAISGRTGGANANQWIDDLKLEAFPADSSSVENGQIVSFIATANNPSLFSVQPAIASNGTLTYTPAPNACGLATVSVVAKDNGGTANGGQDTSAAKTFTINIACVNDCPSAGSQTVNANAGTPKSITLTGSDVDGNALTYAISQAPAHGVVIVQAQTGAATYTATAGYQGPDSFSYTVTDGSCVSSAGVVTINVTGTPNTAPTAKILATPLLDFSPSIANKVLISGDGNEACLKLDGSLSSDAESAATELTYLWFVEPSPLPFASGVVVSNYCLEIGTHTIVLAVTDPQGLTGTDSLTVEVLTVGEAIEELITRVNDSTIERKNKRPFIASLKAAAASADRGNNESAANQLHAFQNKVRAQVGKQNPAEAAVWIRWAQQIIDAME